MYYIISNICILFFCMIGSGFTNDTKIASGTLAKLSDFPYQVSVLYTLQDLEDSRLMCGGTLIHLNYVLTAAHCTEVPDFVTGYVVAGTTYWTGMNELGETVGERIKIMSYIIHNNYKLSPNRYDIAILKLVSHFVQSATIRPIELTHGVPEDGALCIVSGWGATRESGRPSRDLLYTKVAIINKAICNLRYLDLNIDDMICTGPEGRGFCMGDDGGPLVCGNKLCGVASAVSLGYGCGSRAEYGVYTNVYELKNWIEENGSGTLIINNIYLISMLIVSLSFKLFFKK